VWRKTDGEQGVSLLHKLGHHTSEERPHATEATAGVCGARSERKSGHDPHTEKLRQYVKLSLQGVLKLGAVEIEYFLLMRPNRFEQSHIYDVC